MSNLKNGLTPGAIAELFAKTNIDDVKLVDADVTGITFRTDPVVRSMNIPVVDVRVIEGEDWAGLWINDELVYQNHTIRLHDIERFVGPRPMWFQRTAASDALNRWLFDLGSFIESDSFNDALNRVDE